MHKLLQKPAIRLLLTLFIGLPGISEAGQFDNSLWIGNNGTSTFPILNTDRAGNELRRVDATEATGIAIDPVANRIYFGTGAGQITGRDLTNPALPLATLNPPVTFASDMAFDGTYLWRTDSGNREVQKIDPNTGTVVFSFTPDVYVLGIAWDGSNLWLSEYNGFLGNERIIQYTPQGLPTGVAFPAPLGGAHVGGLAFDTSDNTLWIGSTDQVYHVDTTGTLLGSFSLPASNRFIDGLEFQGIERSIISLIGSGTLIPGSNSVFSAFPQSPALAAGSTVFLGTGAGQAGVFVAIPGIPLSSIANLTTLIPNGIGTFTSFGAIAAAGTSTSFIGNGIGQAGVYVAIPNEPFRPVATLTTPIPNGIGTFTSFGAIAAAGTSTSFIGNGIGQAGVYVAIPTDPIRPVADLTTLIPNGIGTFTSFGAIAAAGTSTSFIGNGIGQAGVYVAIPSDPVRPVADLTTLIPNGIGTFTSFGAIASAGTSTSFIGNGIGQAGVYVAIPQEPIRPVADLTTQIPGGIGTFTGFSSLSSSVNHTAFLGTGSNGQAGVYLASTLSKVIAVGDSLNGKRVTALRFGSNGLDGVNVAFTAGFADGTQGVFKVRVNNYAYTGFFVPVSNPPAVNLAVAGCTVPMKFSLKGNQGVGVIAAGYPKSQPIACPAGVPVNTIPNAATAPANKLTYNAKNDVYTYGWSTQKSWKNTCREFQLRLNDGTLHKASFRFK